MVIGLHQMQAERLMAAPKPDERLVILAAKLSLADQNVASPASWWWPIKTKRDRTYIMVVRASEEAIL